MESAATGPTVPLLRIARALFAPPRRAAGLLSLSPAIDTLGIAVAIGAARALVAPPGAPLLVADPGARWPSQPGTSDASDGRGSLALVALSRHVTLVTPRRGGAIPTARLIRGIERTRRRGTPLLIDLGPLQARGEHLDVATRLDGVALLVPSGEMDAAALRRATEALRPATLLGVLLVDDEAGGSRE